MFAQVSDVDHSAKWDNGKRGYEVGQQCAVYDSLFSGNKRYENKSFALQELYNVFTQLCSLFVVSFGKVYLG